ncbi:MAG: hypothetical protein Q4D64_11765 [Prevotellaceae bacterium]|nr:hypothetical protein [Prevotellaceae bacterium]
MGYLAEHAVFMPLTKIVFSNKTGCRYLIVDAYNSEIPLAFYKKNGFDFIFSTEEQEKDYRKIVSDEPLRTRLMFFDLILIK